MNTISLQPVRRAEFNLQLAGAAVHLLTRDPAIELQLVPALRGPAGTAGVGYVHQQPTPSAVWTINHNIGRKVNTDAFTVGGLKMLAEVVNISDTQTQILFDTPMSGYAVTN